MQMKKIMLFGMMSVIALSLISSSAWAQGKLICISNKGLKGDQTVNSCLAKGDEFAIVDQFGVVRILSKREVELTRAFNPKFFEQKAYGMQYQELAPALKIFGYTVVPEKPKK